MNTSAKGLHLHATVGFQVYATKVIYHKPYKETCS